MAHDVHPGLVPATSRQVAGRPCRSRSGGADFWTWEAPQHYPTALYVFISCIYMCICIWYVLIHLLYVYVCYLIIYIYIYTIMIYIYIYVYTYYRYVCNIYIYIYIHDLGAAIPPKMADLRILSRMIPIHGNRWSHLPRCGANLWSRGILHFDS